MKLLNELKKINRLYNQGENIIAYVNRCTNKKFNSLDSIAVSYDCQAGSYIRDVEKDNTYIQNYTKALAAIINQMGPYQTILEAGVGEATTIAHLLPKLAHKMIGRYGFDISWSRIKYGQWYIKKKNIINVNLFLGDLFSIPLSDNSIDIVYTSHSIEPNGGFEKKALTELYRVTNKYLILLEPAWEFANAQARAHMEKHGYVQNLYKVVHGLKYNVIEHRLFDLSANPLNPTGLTIIEKNSTEQTSNRPFACPVTKKKLELIHDCYFSKDSLLAYPIIHGVPVLLEKYAVVAAHFLNF